MKRILITRSPHQASDLADRLRALGAEPILIPTIELSEPTTFTPLDDALAHIGTFHWLLFTSANAVEAFDRRREHLGHSEPLALGPWPSATAAIGPATARALEAVGISPTLIPPQAVAESLTEALLPHALQPDGSPTRFLLIRAETARDHLPNTLRAAGADVTIAPAYRTVIPAESVAHLKTLFATPETWPDAITFTSSSTAQNLFTLLEASGLTLPPSILRASIGPITSQTLRDLGCPPHVEAAEATIPALVEILVKGLYIAPAT
jgi:uroporphyrinogen-III synthase